jgi:hypothetical protein
MNKLLWIAGALAAAVSTGALAQQSGGSAKTKSSAQNLTHCLKAEQNKKDRMQIQNNCSATVNVVYCWKGGQGDKSKYSCGSDGHMERIEQGKRIATRGEPKGDSRLMFFGCESPASPTFTSTSGTTPQGVCKR